MPLSFLPTATTTKKGDSSRSRSRQCHAQQCHARRRARSPLELGLSPLLVVASVGKNDNGTNDEDDDNGDDNNSTNINNADNHCQC